jgi:hypothetical protein
MQCDQFDAGEALATNLEVPALYAGILARGSAG